MNQIESLETGSGMNHRAQRIAAALMIGLAAPASMTACAPGGGSMSDDQVALRLEEAVVSAVPLAEDAYVGFGTAGSPSTRSVLVRLYVDSADVVELATAVDTTFVTIWREMPIKPSSIGVQAFQGSKPAEPRNGSVGNIELTDVHEALGFGYLGRTKEEISLSAGELGERYGQWAGPDAG